MSASKPLAEMTVEELLVGYEQLPASERETHAVELDSRGVLDGTRPPWPVRRYACWLFAQQGAQPVDDPDFDVIYEGRRTQVHGRHEHQRAPLYATVRWDPDEQKFDDYALVAVAPEYRAAEALLCDWKKLQLHVRPYRGRWRVNIASLRRSSGLLLVELPERDPTATLSDDDRERTYVARRG